MSSVITVDCEWNIWTEWSDCSESCGEGMTTRDRDHAVEAEFDGKQCEGETNEEMSCLIKQCPGKVNIKQDLEDLVTSSYINFFKF